MTKTRVGLVLAFLATAAAATLAWYCRNVYPFRIQVTRHLVDLPRSPEHAGLSGLTIAFVTDTHIGPHVDASILCGVRDELATLRPDIILLGGDYISESPRFMASAAQALGEVAATACLGTWGVLGNHDLANQRHRVIDPLMAQGIEILENEASCVETGRGQLWVVAIDDALLGNPDLISAWADVPPGAIAISLWHEPDCAEANAAYGPLLQLSGHTHGGQVRLPGIGPIALPVLGRRYVDGRHQLGETTLIVSRGIGMYRPPVRFNCPAELVIITLV